MKDKEIVLDQKVNYLLNSERRRRRMLLCLLLLLLVLLALLKQQPNIALTTMPSLY